MIVNVYHTHNADPDLFTFVRPEGYSGPVIPISAPQGAELRQYLPDGEVQLRLPGVAMPLTALQAVLASRHGLHGLTDQVPA